MTNLREEVIEVTKNEVIRCAEIKVMIDYDTYENYDLHLNHTTDELESYLNSLNLEYDSGYGTQHVYGTIWLENGSWLERSEYDGSEHWRYVTEPTIPNKLRVKQIG
jgi:hypothetical protein